jgi:hypothetical protein
MIERTEKSEKMKEGRVYERSEGRKETTAAGRQDREFVCVCGW